MSTRFEPGEIVYHAEYARVRDSNYSPIAGGAALELTSADNKLDYIVRGQDLIDQYISGSQFTQTKKVTLTKLAELLEGAGPLPFTVCFVKTNGDTRVLSGRLVDKAPVLGRCTVFDFDTKTGSPLRLVNQRTMRWLILDGTKYTTTKEEEAA